MSRFFFFFSLGISLVFAKSLEWRAEKDFSLKKDEILNARISSVGREKPLSIRWTLYKKDGLVLLLKYDSFPYQFILYKDSQRNSFSLDLAGQDEMDERKLIIIFKDFKDQQADLKFLVRGDANLIFDQDKTE